MDILKMDAHCPVTSDDQTHKILPYLDDWFLCTLTKELAIWDMSTLFAHIIVLSLTENLENSSLISKQAT